jgi:hypothetical protein
MWFTLASSAGNQVAVGNRDKVVAFMDQTQIVEAQNMARAWRPQPVSGPSILIRPLNAGSSH